MIIILFFYVKIVYNVLNMEEIVYLFSIKYFKFCFVVYYLKYMMIKEGVGWLIYYLLYLF